MIFFHNCIFHILKPKTTKLFYYNIVEQGGLDSYACLSQGLKPPIQGAKEPESKP
jgi:hypothetical protein